MYEVILTHHSYPMYQDYGNQGNDVHSLATKRKHIHPPHRLYHFP